MPTSDSTSSKVTFTGCEFKVANYFTEANTDPNELVEKTQGGYADAWNAKNTADCVHLHNATIRPYGTNVKFEECEFSADMVFDFSEVTGKVEFVNCKIGGTPLTNVANFNGAGGFTKLISVDGAVLTPTGKSGFASVAKVVYNK